MSNIKQLLRDFLEGRVHATPEISIEILEAAQLQCTGYALSFIVAVLLREIRERDALIEQLKAGTSRPDLERPALKS